MTFGKQILVLLLGIIYFVSSTGILVFKTNCACIGQEQLSVYVTPEKCDAKVHQHHAHDSENNTISCCEHECHECATGVADCGCQSPETYFIKLLNPTVNNENHSVRIQQSELIVALTCVYTRIISEVAGEIDEPILSVPPLAESNSLEFLIQIHQLKIPAIA